jgi:Asp/Glu/hydantoin racemase
VSGEGGAAGRARVVFLHTSAAALGPVASFYKERAPDLDAVNLLDDGLLGLLAAGRHGEVQTRLASMIGVGRDTHGARAALLTCSSVTGATLAALRAGAAIPVVKIDEGMARAAVAVGRRLGVLATFPPTLAPTRALLEAAAATGGGGARPLVVDEEIAPGAYDALLGGDGARHDELVAEAAARLSARGVDALVLAQVSTARALPAIEARVDVPVLSSLRTSLDDLRAALAAGAVP